MAKTEGQIVAARYVAYQKAGGKLGFWEWRNAGMPARDKGNSWNFGVPSLTVKGNTVSGSTTPLQGVNPSFQWNLPTGQTIPTGGLNLQTVSTPATPSPATPAPVPQVRGATSYKVIYGGTVWQGDDGKYYDPDTGFELDADEVNYRYQYFLQNKVSPLNAPPVSGPTPMTPYQQGVLDIQRQQEERARQQWEAQQYAQQVERERQQAEARNKEWLLKYELQKEASESAIGKQRNEIELIKGRSFPFPYEQGNRQAYQDMQRTAFENARQSILGSLSSPADWIKRWEVENAQNPYTVQQPSPLESSQSDVSNTKARINMFNQMADAADKLVTELSANPDYGAGTPNEATVLTQARNDVTNYRNAAEAEKGRLVSFQSNVTYLQGQPQPEPSRPGAPGNAPSPAWLPAFAPGQRIGQPISRENVATPSAQQWTSTPWSVQQGLSGYLDWAGYRPMADVLGNMAQMLPNAPGGGSRWSPYIGR